MEPLISIIVPVYNVEKYLEICLQSLINQTYKKTEIILVDDMSTDGSALICDRYENEYENIRVIHKMKNEGLGYARNTGIDYVNGDFLLFIDSDDYVDLDYVEEMYKNISNNAADACMGGYTSVQGENQIQIANCLAGTLYKNEQVLPSIIPLMCGRDNSGKTVQMSACMIMYKTVIIKNNELRFPSERKYISEDLLFNIDYLKRCNTVFCSNIVGYYYRYNPSSLTHSYLMERFERQKIMTSKIIEVTSELGIYELCEQRIINTFLGWTRACLKMEQANYKANGFKSSINNIRKICRDELVSEYVKKQQIGHDKFFSYLINMLIKYRLSYIIFGVMGLKNKFEV